MAYNATVIAASLDDKELRNSINSLVQYVEDGTQKMGKAFDNFAAKIQNALGNLNTSKLANLPNIKVNSALTNEKQAQDIATEAVKQNTAAHKEKIQTLDQEARVMQTIAKSSTTQEGYAERATLAKMQVGNEVRITEEIRKQAQAIRESEEFRKTGRYKFEAYGVSHQVFANEKKYTSVENQLLNIMAKQASYSKELFADQGESAKATSKWAEAQERIARAEEQHLQSLKTEEEKQREIARHLQEAQTAYAETRRNQERNMNLSVPFRVEATTEGIKRLEEAYKNLDATDRRTAFGKELRAYIQGLKGELVTLKDRMNDDILMSTNLGNSYLQLGRKLQRLQTIYQGMNETMRNSTRGQEIADAFQRTSRAMSEIQRQMNRPVSLEKVLGLNPKTLDDMAYKMQQLQLYKQGIDITKPSNVLEMERVNTEIGKLKRELDKYMVAGKQTTNINNALSRSWNYMKNRLAFYFTVGATTQFIKSLVDVRGQYELLERSIGILINSAQNGSKIFAELNAMALKSPFTTMELGAAAKQLVAYDVAAKDVVDTTRRLADMAAAVGIPMERLTYALGQIKAYGYLNARDARMFANAGIPLVKQLADYYTQLEGRMVSTSDVYDRIKKKAIDYSDVMEVVNKMTDEGGKFFNFQEKSADTLKVRLANLTLAWNNMLNEMGKDSQGVLTGFLVETRKVFEHWRDIKNALEGALWVLGLAKAAQAAYLILTAKTLNQTRALVITQQVLGKNVAKLMASLGKWIIANPLTLVGAAVAGLAVAFAKCALDYRDLMKANEEFNAGLVKNAQENIDSVDKFFEDYRKQFNSIGELSNADQQKMWERIKEEIENATKNAEQYLEVLNKAQDLPSRIKMGEGILEQTKEIQAEVQRLAELKILDLGGGMGDDSLAEDLKEADEYATKLVKKYGSLQEAQEKLGGSSYATDWGSYTQAIAEAGKELESFTSKLDNANIERIMGEDPKTQLANIREFANIIRENFLSTEQGQKVGQGVALLNSALDNWVANVAKANSLITDSNAEAVERNRSAWETFFNQFNEEDRERLDYLIKNNQTGSEDFKKLWDKAAKAMEERSWQAYYQIQQQIANLRNTPDIVINVVYRTKEKESYDEQIKQFEKDYLTPENGLPMDEYWKQKTELVRKYGRYIKKENEDNVEWEERLGQEYQKNKTRIASLNDQLKNSADLALADKKAKQDELDALKKQQEGLKEIADRQHFNLEQFAKGSKGAGSKKDVLGDALQEEVRLIDEIQKRYKEYRSIGVSSNEAMSLASKEYNKSLHIVNATLASFGIKTKEASEYATMDLRDIRSELQSLLDAAMHKGNAKGIEALEKAIAKVNEEITKIDYQKITEGLDNELSKLKEDYELAIELDANPELSDIFLDMFDLDVNEMPKTIEEYAARVTEELNKAIKARKNNLELDSLLDLTPDDIKAFGDMVISGTLDEKSFEEIKKMYDELRKLRQKDQRDTLNKTRELQYKLVDTYDKIAIETEKLENLRRLRAKETRKEKQRLLDLEIQDQERTIARLKDEVLEMLPTYKALFNSITSHSARVTRKIAKQWKTALENAVHNADNTWTITDPMTGDTATISEQKYGKEINHVNAELRKTQTIFNKIKSDFSKGDEGIVDWVQGISDLADEFDKVADGLNTVADIMDELGASAESVEIVGDVANTISGLSEASKGLAQIANGDVIGGTVGVIKGVWKSISTWFDNKNNKIDRQIEQSTITVRKLALEYQKLEYAVDKALGTAETQARRAAIANKEAQLAELERQLMLEQQKSYKKNSNKKEQQERIDDYLEQVESLRQEIQNAKEDIVNNLLGSDVKSAAEDFVNTWVDAWRAGETTLDAITEKMDDMIANLVNKAATSAIVKNLLQPLYNSIEQYTQESSRGGVALTLDEIQALSVLANQTSTKINDALGAFYNNIEALGVMTQQTAAQSELSALQQGIQGITETTANALEAYASNISQQVYFQSDILAQIRDMLQLQTLDVQTVTTGEILLQLQASYITQEAIRSTLEGWNNATGQAVRVELIS